MTNKTRLERFEETLKAVEERMEGDRAQESPEPERVLEHLELLILATTASDKALEVEQERRTAAMRAHLRYVDEVIHAAETERGAL